MGSEWRDIPLGEFVRLQRGYDLPESKREVGTIPVMGSAGLTGYHNRALADGPGITIGRSGVGSAGVVSYSAEAYWPHNTTLFVTDFLGNNPRFVFYRLKSMNLRSVDSGSAQASINRNFLYPIRLSVPARPEQDEIARVLGTLDDKIESNRRMNATLEGLAQAVFRSWFVDYDPVVAKAAGRRPVGMDAATAALFPKAFADSPLGPIPKGWRAGTLADVCSINSRSIRGNFGHEEIEYIDISSVTVGHLEGTTRYSRKDAPSRAQRLVSHGDTLWSCVRPNRKSYLLVDCPASNVVASTGFVVLTSKASAPYFLHLTVTTDEFVDYLETR